MDIDLCNNYIDSILCNYQKLGQDPCVSILSEKIYEDGRLIHIIYSSNRLYECNTKHQKKCQCKNLIYEKFFISNTLDIKYYPSKNDIPHYINDLSNLIYCLYQNKNFYLSSS